MLPLHWRFSLSLRHLRIDFPISYWCDMLKLNFKLFLTKTSLYFKRMTLNRLILKTYFFWVPSVELIFLSKSIVLKIRIISRLTEARTSTISLRYLAAFSLTSELCWEKYSIYKMPETFSFENSQTSPELLGVL